jgi:D-alanine-D-alanine ligase
VGLTYNLKKNIASQAPDEEAEYDHISTPMAIRETLEKAGCAVTLMEADRELPARLAQTSVDIVFNIAEGIGGRGREAQVPALLSLLGIPFTGSDETTLCVALDKALAKRILASHHVITPRSRVVSPYGPRRLGGLSFPVIVKPNAEGSSKGIGELAVAGGAAELESLVDEKLRLYRQELLVEEYITGREFTVGLLGNGEETRAFSPMEIFCLDEKSPYNIYSYPVKQDWQNRVRYQCPAPLEPAQDEQMRRTALKIYRLLGCRDFARVDFRLSPQGKLYFLEINPLPGLAPGHSDYPMIAAFCGMDYACLVRNILDAALKRHGLAFSLGEGEVDA